ncbi:hypothetical protein WS52_16060 [Burkholderia territorii]|nr:hypothetical protein WS52_16060 [Burkholderia territorii]KUZ52865.1 hypothetical protein WS53_17470 [Burkholderia territorii]
MPVASLERKFAFKLVAIAIWRNEVECFEQLRAGQGERVAAEFDQLLARVDCALGRRSLVLLDGVSTECMRDELGQDETVIGVRFARIVVFADDFERLDCCEGVFYRQGVGAARVGAKVFCRGVDNMGRCPGRRTCLSCSTTLPACVPRERAFFIMGCHKFLYTDTGRT